MRKIIALGLLGALANSTLVEPCEHTAAQLAGVYGSVSDKAASSVGTKLINGGSLPGKSVTVGEVAGKVVSGYSTLIKNIRVGEQKDARKE
jgi:hypothetical protein